MFPRVRVPPGPPIEGLCSHWHGAVAQDEAATGGKGTRCTGCRISAQRCSRRCKQPTLGTVLCEPRVAGPTAAFSEGGHCTCGDVNCRSPGRVFGERSTAVKTLTTSSWQIQRWWKHWPSANVGIATGVAPGLLVFDIDPRNGGDVSYEQLRKEYPASFAELLEVGPAPVVRISISNGEALHHPVPTFVLASM